MKIEEMREREREKSEEKIKKRKRNLYAPPKCTHTTPQ